MNPPVENNKRSRRKLKLPPVKGLPNDSKFNKNAGPPSWKGDFDQEQAQNDSHERMLQRYGSTKAERRVIDLSRIPSDIPELDPELLVENRDEGLRVRGILEPEKTFVFFGKRGTGKTFCLRYLISYLRRHYPRVIVLTDTLVNGFWQQYVHKDYIHKGFDPFVIEQALDQQEALMHYINLEHPELKEVINPNMAIIMDDVITAHTFKFSEHLDALFAQGRHNHISPWITSQYAKAVNTLGRGNIDWAFILPQFMEIQEESICNDFLNFVHKDAGYEIIDRFTAQERLEEVGAPKHQILAIKICENSKDMNKILFKVNAEDPGNFYLGDPLWQKIPGM